MTKLQGPRAALATAIETRNAAAQTVEAAKRHLDAYEEGFVAARSKSGDANEALDAVKARHQERLAMYMGNRAVVLQDTLRETGKTPDELLINAQKEAADAEEAFQAARGESERLKGLRAIAEADLERAKTAVDQAIGNVFAEQVPVLASHARTLMAESTRALSALRFATRSLNLRDKAIVAGHELHEAAGLVVNYTNWDGFCTPEAAYQKEGAQPWLNAFQLLQVDANAPLPIDPQPAKKAAA